MEADILKCQAVCLTNRAAAQKMLNRLPQAIQDCRSAIARDSGHVKAYIRAARYHLQRVETDQARDCLSGLSRDLLNADDVAEIKSIEAEIYGISANMGKLEEVPTIQLSRPFLPYLVSRLEAMVLSLKWLSGFDFLWWCHSAAHCSQRWGCCGIIASKATIGCFVWEPTCELSAASGRYVLQPPEQ